MRAPALAASFAVAAALAGAVPAFAGDGRIEINQRSVLAAGGFPFAIRQPGSYVLTGALSVPAGTTGIRIQAHGVQLDLNGFPIASSHVCDQSACPLGAGVGIEAAPVSPSGPIASRTTLVGGEVRGFGQDCVRLGPDARVEGLAVSSCGGSGVFVEERGLLRGNRVSFCGAFGLRLIDPTSYAHNLVSVTDLGSGTGGAVSGGINGGGNVCDVSRCPGERRRYYQTSGSVPGNHGASVCVAGFHMASLWEIHDPTELDYATALGRKAADSGSGPSLGFGWIRTGWLTSSTSQFIGFDNCNVWASANAQHRGSIAGPSAGWSSAAVVASPWTSSLAGCDATFPAWWVED